MKRPPRRRLTEALSIARPAATIDASSPSAPIQRSFHRISVAARSRLYSPAKVPQPQAGGQLERDPVYGYARGRKSLDYVLFHPPGHRADESFWGRRRIGSTYPQELRYERRIVRDPVSHHYSTTGPRDTDDLLGHIERAR